MSASDAGRPTVPLPVGYRVGDWSVTDLIASGSWSSVYAARRTGGGADEGEAALKILPGGSLTPRQHSLLAEVARRELRFSREVGHPHLVRILETHVVSDPTREELDGAIVLVMERAAGSLGDLLARAAPGRPLAGAARLLAETCEGLAHMHALGWVHGDLKPSNVLVMRDGSVRLADFGLSAELEGTHAYLPPLGSSDYLPPEWWSERAGDRGVAARPSRDIWAFGVLAHQVLSGGLFPMPGATARARAAAVQAYAAGRADLRLASAVPPAWQAVIADCLAREHTVRAALAAADLAARCRALEAGDVARPPRRRVAGAARTALLGAIALGVLASGPASPHLASRLDAPAFSGGELRADADVPPAYREQIVAVAHACDAQEVTPALVAAILSAESGFDPRASSPDTDEYGIAMWTPSVFAMWATDTDGGGPSVWSVSDSIAALGEYLCGMTETNVMRVPGDRALLLAASYRAGSARVLQAGGIPPQVADYVAEVERHAREYAEPRPE